MAQPWKATDSFDNGTYKDGEWPVGNCWPKSEECKKLGVTDNLCGKCEALPNGGFKLSETKQGLRYAGASFDDNNVQAGSYQAGNICILARYGNGGMVDFNPTDKCFGNKITAGPQKHWYGNCAKGALQQQTCCSNSALLDSRFEWTHFSLGNSCSGDNDLDDPLGEVNCWFETNPNVIESLRCNGISCVDNRFSDIASIRSWSTNNKTNMSSLTLYPGNGIAYNKSHVVTFTVINPDSPQAATKTVSISSSGIIKIFASPMHHVFPLTSPTFC
jgi:hypothetical protein